MYNISDYRDCQSHGPVIAERVWTAWWQESGLQVGDVAEHLKDMTNPHTLPTGFVAHDGDDYVGSAFLIHCDLEERPQYLPWVAALWVEEGRRRSGVARALMQAATQRAAELGHRTSYLCCGRDLETCYINCGWTVLERGVGKHDLTVLTFSTTG
ncbi:GNAT family N-acetyltransferase [Agrobacterium tumefaciens]|uniref:GNAT family N-acetyltransferase n=1 Tax=Agrobacterium tumefaciens TaxID=358 RepID=UPI0021CEB206|nr:GNAT family N-acetyltransferase [Agrobacterium tumefaciens]UXT49581.1 GNAT family N-acetyltransferase [Agrobacterium tumefaciens]